ncbi:TonB-dependent receptor [Flavobacteriaceae bacterium XHP0103]|uniref:SusC/RagA family TonB-linked outer membrane protein n=1 Tax=Marixanthotalea marina TaxID=2844359 RepID=UPI002989D1EE|nr:TonB-dependent receptor [Marixanthotalea marina]MBU3821956.1 TonB-dependent receptor [Marixanthotalea marina]
MGLKNYYFVLCLLVFNISFSLAQQKTIIGKVVDENNLPLPGATILIKGTNTGTSTDFDGYYTIQVNTNTVLVFSFIGYLSKEITVGNNNTINVTLQEDSTSLEEVVVVAYGSQKRESIVGAVGVISSSTIETQQVTSPLRALQGAVPGVSLLTSGGQPGSNPTIRIRGISSESLEQGPLIVVDGAPFNGNLNTISQDQIESISILKDASSSALYGSRASGGVILITTKRGYLDSAPKITFRSQIGISNPTIGIHDLVNPEDYLKLTWQALKNTSQFGNGFSAVEAAQNATNGLIDYLGYNPYSVNNPIDTNGNLVSGANLLWESDWEKEVIRQDYLRVNHNLSLSGGSEKTRYFMSFDYLNEDGPVTTSNFERVATRMNLETQVNDWFKIGMNSSFSRSNSNEPDQTSDNTIQTISWIYGLSSIYPIYARDANGNLILDNAGNKIFDLGNGLVTGQPVNSTRPVYSGENLLASITLGKEKRIRTNYLANAFAEINLTKNLTFKTRLSYENYTFDSFSFDDDKVGIASNVKGRVSQDRNITTTLNAIQSLNYTNSFGKHNLSIDAITEAYTNTQDDLLAQGTGFLPGVENLDSSTVPETVGGNVITSRINSYLGRASYNFDEKYYGEFSFRRDGSTRFNEATRWGNFLAAGASWIISRENFLTSSKTLTYLKLRGSYGELGNNRTNRLFPYQSVFQTGFVNEGNSGILLEGVSDVNLRWEKVESYNVGIDFELFNGALSGTLDYYNKESVDLIMDKPLPRSLGVNKITTNIGAIKNFGWEASLKSINFNTQDFIWTTGINVALNQNEWTKLPQDEIITGTKRYVVGGSIFDFFIQEWAGVDPADGRGMWYKDVLDAQGNVINKVTTKNYDEATRYDQGKTSLPNIEGGFTSFLKYKQFDLNVLFNFSFGAYLLDTDYSRLINPFENPGGSAHPDNFKAWKAPGDITNFPLLLASNNDHASRSTRFLFKNDYIRLKSLTLGYNLPDKTINKFGLSKFRLFIQADNILTWQSHKGIDPEQAFNGLSNNRSPLSKTLTSGLILEF